MDRLRILLEARPTTVIPPQLAKLTVNRLLHLPIQPTVPLQTQTLCPVTQVMVLEPMPALRLLAPIKEHWVAQMMALALVLGTMPEAHPLVQIKNHQVSLHLSLSLHQRPRTQALRLLPAMLECPARRVLKKELVRTAKMALLLTLLSLSLGLQETLPHNHLPEAKATTQ